MKHFSTIFLLVISLFLFSCEEKTGTCETSLINYQGYRLYKCDENKEEYLCESTGSDYDQVFYTNKSCQDLGYSYYNGDDWQYSSTSNGTPGPYGKWGNGTGSGGGGSAGVCSGGYKSPVNDAQLDAYCGAAYAYRCLQGKPVSSTEVQTPCKYYEDMKVAGVPKCSYCY